MDIVSTMIQTEIDAYDKAACHQNNMDVELGNKAAGKSASESDSDSSDLSESDSEPSFSPRIIHGSLRPPCSLAKLETSHSSDRAFRNIKTKLSAALAKQLNIARVTLRASDTVSYR